MRRISLAAALLCWAASGQQPAAGPSFEVASVKPSAPGQMSFDIEPGPDTLRMRNVTLRQAIQFAYHLHEYQMSGGPKWVDAEGFDITGKTDDSLRALEFSERTAHLAAMLQRLLAERFQLVMRREMRPVPAFALSLAKGGFLLKRIEPGGPKRIYGRPDQLVANGATIAEFIGLLEAKLQQPVLNHTGVEGLHNFQIQFAPNNVPDSPYPSIFTALQEQCGLKLERATTPAETFAIERAEKPSEN